MSPCPPASAANVWMDGWKTCKITFTTSSSFSIPPCPRLTCQIANRVIKPQSIRPSFFLIRKLDKYEIVNSRNLITTRTKFTETGTKKWIESKLVYPILIFMYKYLPRDRHSFLLPVCNVCIISCDVMWCYVCADKQVLSITGGICGEVSGELNFNDPFPNSNR